MEQLTINDFTKINDLTSDRRDKKYPAPSWMNYKRCENCQRWAKLQFDDQPPEGWGVYGFCNEHKHRTDRCGYCNEWEEKKDEQG